MTTQHGSRPSIALGRESVALSRSSSFSKQFTGPPRSRQGSSSLSNGKPLPGPPPRAGPPGSGLGGAPKPLQRQDTYDNMESRPSSNSVGRISCVNDNKRESYSVDF